MTLNQARQLCLGLLCALAGCEATTAARPPAARPVSKPVNGRLERIDGLDVLRLWGTREQMGYAEGAILCRRIPRFFADYYLDFLVPMLKTSYPVLSGKLLPRYALAPGDERELWAMLRGIRERCPAGDLLVRSAQLEGGQRELRHEDLVFASVAYEMFLGCSAFTVWAAASASRATLHARNVDFLLDPGAAYTREQILKVYDEPGQARWASVSWPGSLVCHTCLTEAGLGITVNGTIIRPADKSATRQIPLASAYRQTLAAAPGEGAPLEPFISRLREIPVRTGANLNVFWGCQDARGIGEPHRGSEGSTPVGASCTGGVVLEHDGDTSHADGRVTVRRPGEADALLATHDAIIATNHHLKRTSTPGNPESVAHYERLRTGIDQAARAGGVSVAGAKDLMAAVAARGPVLTLVTVILDTATRRLHLYRTTSAGKPATDSKPSVIDLAAVFGAKHR